MQDTISGTVYIVLEGTSLDQRPAAVYDNEQLAQLLSSSIINGSYIALALNSFREQLLAGLRPWLVMINATTMVVSSSGQTASVEGIQGNSPLLDYDPTANEHIVICFARDNVHAEAIAIESVRTKSRQRYRFHRAYHGVFDTRLQEQACMCEAK